MMSLDFSLARVRLAGAQRILAMTHINPDGDAVGSLLGFGLAARAAGKDVVFACADPVADVYHYLTGATEITTAPEGEFEVIVALDAADAGRLGQLQNTFIPRLPDIVFDHHATNPGFGHINLIEPHAASTAELVVESLEAFGWPLTQPIAEALLTGIVADTLGFRTAATTPNTLAQAQKLMQAGASLSAIYDQLLFKRSLAATRLWAEGLAHLQWAEGVVWATLSLAARQRSQYLYKDDGDLINILSGVREAEAALVFVERPEHKVKVSWRSAGLLNVAVIAQQFGGGGHAAAAGAEVPGTLAEVEAQVLSTTQAALRAVSTAAVVASEKMP